MRQVFYHCYANPGKIKPTILYAIFTTFIASGSSWAQIHTFRWQGELSTIVLPNAGRKIPL